MCGQDAGPVSESGKGTVDRRNRPQRGDDPLRDRAPQPIDHRDISPITDGCSMKILHVITGLNYGGAENMLSKLIETGAGTNARFQNVVLSMMTPGTIADRIQNCGVSVHSLRMRQGVPSPHALFRLFHIIRAVQPDLILGWMPHVS